MPDQLSKEAHTTDWKVQLMISLAEATQERDMSFVPIVGLYDQQYRYVPSIVEMMQISKDQLPMLYVMHPLTDQVVPYPEPLDDVANISPELVLLWARRTVLALDLQYWADKVREAQASGGEKADAEI